MVRGLLCAALALWLLAPSRAHAQECRRTCRVDETRDAAGCCVAAASAAPAATRPLPRRCPAGTQWSDRARACMGRLVCPVGAHPDEGGACVADAVVCPPGTRREQGRCVADVTCPANTRLENDACVAAVTCPPRTTLEAGQCVSSEVSCPEGTRPREGGAPGCVGEPVCPASTRFVEGRGCVGDVVCPRGTRLDGAACVPEVVCVEGQAYVDGRCVDACAAVAHSHWEGARRLCVCDRNFTAVNGRCVAGCAPGTHREGRECVADVVCPEGWVFSRARRGCLNPEEFARAEQEARARQAREAHERAVRWVEGPAVQLWVAPGFGVIEMPDAFRIDGRTVPGRWGGFAMSAGATFSSQGLVVGASYTRLGGTSGFELPNSGGVRYNALDMLVGEIGIQGVGGLFSWRILLHGGYDFGQNGVPLGADARGMFRLIAGLYVGLDVRFLGLLRLEGGFPGGACRLASDGGCDPTGAPPTRTNSVFAPGVAALATIGYSIH